MININFRMFYKVVILISGLGLSAPILADTKQSDDQGFDNLIEGAVKFSGLFSFYQNSKNGSMILRLSPKQLDKDFLYLVQGESGVIDFVHSKGFYPKTAVYRFHRHFDRVEVEQQNTQFYIDANNPMKRANKANINYPILASVKILAEDNASGDILINADELLLNENLYQVKPYKKNGKGVALGTLNKEKTKYVAVNNYPQNSDVIVQYSYDTPIPKAVDLKKRSLSHDAITSTRSINVQIRHSFVEAPKNDFIPRTDDPRIGYFMQAINDMGSQSATPYLDVIDRWHLVKKDPSSALSEPVEPIVWWLSNTTPFEYRGTVKQAVLSWNIAFERAGFKNAIIVKQQPDHADWSAGDIRYNVIDWVSAPQPRTTAYGTYFSDPRTGQILGADIMIQFSILKKYLTMNKLYQLDDISLSQETSSEARLYQSAQFGSQALLVKQESDTELNEFGKSFLFYLAMHEVGHTLGLMHNMKASQMWDENQIHNRELTQKHGLMASVMDYPPANIAPIGIEQGEYYTSRPGPYDLWAIDYGYSVETGNAETEQQRLKEILKRASDPLHAFGNDYDQMGRPGVGIDPRVNTEDMTNNAVGYSITRLELLRQLSTALLENVSPTNQSYQELTNTFHQLQKQYGNNLRIIASYIGGVYVDRSNQRQEDKVKPFLPVPKSIQVKAMNALSEFAFAPDAFNFSENLLAHLQQQRRGFDFHSTTEDPKVHEIVLRLQQKALNHILHPTVLSRIQDSTLYGNKYELSEVLDDLTKAIFSRDQKSNVNVFRQNLQIEYVERLSAIAKEAKDYQHSSRSLAHYFLKEIKKTQHSSDTNVSTRAHKLRTTALIDRALKD